MEAYISKKSVKTLRSFHDVTWFRADGSILFWGGELPLYFGLLVARLFCLRSSITQFELTLLVQGEQYPEATELDNSRNTMKSNITHPYTHTSQVMHGSVRSHACTHTCTHTFLRSRTHTHYALTNEHLCVHTHKAHTHTRFKCLRELIHFWGSAIMISSFWVFWLKRNCKLCHKSWHLASSLWNNT